MFTIRISIEQLRTMLAHADRAGVDTDRVLASLGLSQSELCAATDPGLLWQAHDQLGRALRTALSVARGERPFDETDREILFHYLVSAADLRQVLERFVGFAASHRERLGFDYRLESSPTAVILRGCHHTAADDASTTLILLRSANQLHYLMSWLSGSRVQATRVAVPGPRPDSAPPLWAIDTEIAHGAASFEMWFLPQVLQRAVIRDRADAEIYLGCIGSVVAGLSAQLSLPDTVSEIIERHCFATGQMLSFRQLAVVLNTSETTLRRRLQEQGAGEGYSELRQGCQMRLARRFLGNAELTVDEIALRIGFQDSNAFRRSFKRWTGMTPSAWRSEALAAGLA